MEGSVTELQSMLGALDCINNPNEPVVHWNDNYFRSHFMENNKLAGRLKLHETRQYAKAFLNWYISGKGAGKLLDLWIGVVSGMLVPTESVSCEHLLTDLMFRRNSGNKEAVKLDPLKDVSKLTNFIYDSEGPQFASCEAKSWYYRIFDMLDKNLANLNSVSPSVIVAINYMGYIALSLLKVLVKDGPKVSHHIIKNVTNEFNGFWPSGRLSIKTPPPHKFSIQQFKHVFQKTSPNCTRELTLVVASHVYTDSFYRTEIQKVLKTACLDYMDLYGMGCLHWLQKASKECSISEDKLIDLMSTSTNRQTNKALQNVLKYYARSGSNQYTWRWARLFVDKAFVEISTSKNPSYAATMAALSCGGDDRSPVWKISQFSNENLKNDAIRMARTILSKLNQCTLNET